MEARMTRARWLAVVACLAVVGCGDPDPARSVKIAAHPPAAAETVVAQQAPAEAVGAPPVATVAPATAAGVVAGTLPESATRPDAGAPPRSAAKAAASAAPAGSLDGAAAAAARSAEWRSQSCPPPPEGASGPSSLAVTGPCAFRHRGAVSCEALVDDFYISVSRKAARGSTLMVYINVENYHGPGRYKDAQMFMSVQDRSSIYRWSNDAVEITVGPNEEFAVLPPTRLDAEPVLVDCTGPMDNFQCGGRRDVAAMMRTSHVASGTLRCDGAGKQGEARAP
jgi:hypothetical protein